ncbi:PEBP-like protein [Clathrospora elynae]|uniref:PEBP-like protein n=1 Tax=Clathrospora elynae TaxID=706981 RepID=A0A6A5S426_9PLEO|nr:PEBP-like protein [Clathrospora elynae]
MYTSTSLFVAALVGFAQAQTPSGFKPQVDTKLDVIFNSTMVNTAGQQISKAAVASQPQIALASGMVSASETYMFVMLDLDVPPANGNTTRRVLLHAMKTGLKATKQKLSGKATLLVSAEKGPAPYLPPSPPATDTVAHRYVQLLFQQPASLSVKASDFDGSQARVNFDIASFMSKNGVSEPVAANFFRVDGRAKAGGSGSATGTGGVPKNTAQPFTGAASAMDVPYGLTGLLAGLALLAV